MRLLILIISLFAATLQAIAQVNEEKSDLRQKVDSIIEFQIGYKIDSTTNAVPQLKWNPERYKGMTPSIASLSPNPLTLILLEGRPISIDSLNNLRLKDVTIKLVYPINDKQVMSLFGNAGKNGMIVLRTKN